MKTLFWLAVFVLFVALGSDILLTLLSMIPSQHVLGG